MTSFLLLAAVSLGPKVDADIVYATVAGTELKLDLYRPQEATAGSRLPVVVVVHGGAWMSGNKKDMAPICEAFAKEGIAAATVQYRLAPAHRWPSMIDDCQTAVRFLRDHAETYGLDPARMGACGASAGGHLSLLLGMLETRDPAVESKTSSKVSCVVNLFGPTDLSQDYPKSLADSLCKAVLGKPYAEAGEEIKDFSPVSHVSAGSAPVFTIHGTADPLVPVVQVDRLDEVLKKAGIEHEVRKVEGMGHALPVEKPEVAKALVEALAWVKAKLLR
ncbi:MAG: alpha/beta hydrolase [Fimbriimonadaceae bacterium]|nr:alpha/beta hydrolase [Fimbriimonadaceae bacterium]